MHHARMDAYTIDDLDRAVIAALQLNGRAPWHQIAAHVQAEPRTVMHRAARLEEAGLLRVIWVANSMDVIFVMTGGGPGYATHTLPLYAFVRARQNLDFGYGTTIAVTFTILLGAIVAVYLSRTMREGER